MRRRAQPGSAGRWPRESLMRTSSLTSQWLRRTGRQILACPPKRCSRHEFHTKEAVEIRVPASVVMASAVGRLKPVRARGAADDYWNRWLAAVALRPDIERLAKRSIKAEARPSAK